MIFDEERASQAVEFIEMLEHIQGREWRGETIDLMLWQEKIVRDVFGRVDEDGNRIIRTLFLEVPRKNGKSLLAASIANYLLYADKEGGAEVYAAATDRDQAKNVWRNAKKQIQRCDPLDDRSRIVDHLNLIENQELDGRFKPLSKNWKKQHGRNIHGLVFDEVHAHGNRELWSALTTASGTRTQPLVVAPTTAGLDRQSLCYDLHKYTRQVNAGDQDDPSFYGVIFSATEPSFPDSWHEDGHPSHPEGWHEDAPERWIWGDYEDGDYQNPDCWRTANPALADGGFLQEDYFRNSVRQAKELPRERQEFKRLHLNIWTDATSSFFDISDWKSCAVERDDQIAPGVAVEDYIRDLPCYLGMDISNWDDLTAIAAAWPTPDLDDVNYFARVWCWAPEATIDRRTREDDVPYKQWEEEGELLTIPGEVIENPPMIEKIAEISQKYNIQEVAVDKFSARELSHEIRRIGEEPVEFPQTYAYLSEPSKELARVVTAGSFRYFDNSCLEWQAGNTVIRSDSKGNIRPDKINSDDKIDAIAALVMAIDGAMSHEIQGHSVYEDRGIHTL